VVEVVVAVVEVVEVVAVVVEVVVVVVEVYMEGGGRGHLTFSYAFCSTPSVTSTTTRPACFRPVRPKRWIERVADVGASKHTIRSTSPMSSPSSPIDVATSTLCVPFSNSRTTARCSFCLRPRPFSPTPLLAWPMNLVGRTPSIWASKGTSSLTDSRYDVNTIARVPPPPAAELGPAPPTPPPPPAAAASAAAAAACSAKCFLRSSWATRSLGWGHPPLAPFSSATIILAKSFEP